MPCRLQNPRPIPINKQALKNFVQDDLLPRINDSLRREVNQDLPLGPALGLAYDYTSINAAHDRDTLIVRVQIDSVRAMGKWAAVLGGSQHEHDGQPLIHLNLNGALSPAELLSTERQQDIWTCNSLTCLPYALYSIMIHEATHASESIFPQRKIDYYSRNEEGEVVNLDMRRYLNDPQEVRANLQEIADEVLRYAQMTPIREHARGAVNPNQVLLDIALSLSTTWKLVQADMTPQNRAKILRVLHTLLEEKGLWFPASGALV